MYGSVTSDILLNSKVLAAWGQDSFGWTVYRGVAERTIRTRRGRGELGERGDGRICSDPVTHPRS